MRAFHIGSALMASAFVSVSVRAAVIPSPSNDILLSSNGGVADINGSTTDGIANYGGLPPANLNDGERDGRYANGLGADGSGSLAHTSGGGAGQEMGVTIPSPTPIGSVIIFNRTDCCDYRIDGHGQVPFTLNVVNAGVLVYTANFTFTQTISLTGFNPITNNTESASGMMIDLPAGTIGNYVQVVQNNNDYMNLAELEAYRPTPEPASLGILGFGALGLLGRRRR